MTALSEELRLSKTKLQQTQHKLDEMESVRKASHICVYTFTAASPPIKKESPKITFLNIRYFILTAHMFQLVNKIKHSHFYCLFNQ